METASKPPADASIDEAVKERIFALDEQTRDLLDAERREDEARQLFDHAKRIWERLSPQERDTLRAVAARESPLSAIDRSPRMRETCCIGMVRDVVTGRTVQS